MSETAENYMDIIFGTPETSEAPETEYPEHILALMKQKETIQRQIDEWRSEEKTKKHLKNVLSTLQKKRSFHDFSPWEFNMCKKAKRIKSYLEEKITNIQIKEKKLLKARNEAKEEIEEEIKAYLSTLA